MTIVGDGKNTESQSRFIDKQPLGVAPDTDHVADLLQAVNGAVSYCLAYPYQPPLTIPSFFLNRV